MLTNRARLTLALDAPSASEQARVWRPFPEQVADILCVEDTPGDVAPRTHGRFAITLLRSPAFIRVESSRSVVAGRNRILLIPRLQLHALRVQGGMGPGPVTLLLGAADLEGLGLPERPALVSDADCGEQVAALVAQLQRPLNSVASVPITRALLERLVAHSMPLRYDRSWRATPLLCVREYLQAHLGEPIPTAVLAPMSGLTEWGLIRAFHLEFGLPPHAYHLRLRLAAASELLSQGLSVSTVAYECGFADQSHLSRKFKEIYGLTPAAWRTATAGARDCPKGRTTMAGPTSGKKNPKF
jgi:AraC-like DNA-binding protein